MKKYFFENLTFKKRNLVLNFFKKLSSMEKKFKIFFFSVHLNIFNADELFL